MKKGFTLLELIVVIIIIGILGTFGFIQYASMLEKGRRGEARANLGSLRSLAIAYNLSQSAWPANIAALNSGLPEGVTVSACTSNTHFFTYACDLNNCTAYRCTGGGKGPQATTTYNLSLEFVSGNWSGSL